MFYYFCRTDCTCSNQIPNRFSNYNLKILELCFQKWSNLCGCFKRDFQSNALNKTLFSSMIFCSDWSWLAFDDLSFFNCLLFLLIVLSEKTRVSNCAIFEIDIPFRLVWRITDPSASFSDLVDQVCLAHLDVCIRLTPLNQSAG